MQYENISEFAVFSLALLSVFVLLRNMSTNQTSTMKQT